MGHCCKTFSVENRRKMNPKSKIEGWQDLNHCTENMPLNHKNVVNDNFSHLQGAVHF